MRNLLVFAAVVSFAGILLAGTNFQPMKVKPGLWQATGESTMSGLPNAQGGTSGVQKLPVNYKSCIRQKDLNTNPWANGSDQKCSWKIVNMTSTDLDVKGTDCAAGKEQGMKSEFEMKIHALNPETVKATTEGTAVGNGLTMKFNSSFTGKWVSASCPAGMK